MPVQSKFSFFAILVGAVIFASLIGMAGFIALSSPDYPEFQVEAVSGYHDFHPDFLQHPDTERVVLYFSAPWCSTCKILDEDIAANQDIIPSDLTILKVDYDSHFALRRQYSVTSQHTLVLIDNQENEVQRWNGTQDLIQVLADLGVTV